MRMIGEELAGSARAVRPADDAPCFAGSTNSSTGDVDQLLESLSRLSSMSSDPDVSDAVRIDRIAALERLQAAAFAAQAAEIARFAASQLAEQRRAGVPARRLGIGIAEQVALACRVSPMTGARRVSLASALTTQLPFTHGLLAEGQISAWIATIVVRETDALTPADRAVVDARLAPTVASMSPRQAEAAARRAAIGVDPASAVRRGRTARTDRRVSIRPAPDTMALITGFVPVEQGVAAWVSLDRDARSRRAGGDPRSLSQIMADTFIERLTGQASAAAVPVEIGLTLTTDSLLRRSDDAPATLPGYGPIPAEFARELAGVRGEPDDLGPVAAEARVFIRRILTDPIDHTVVSVDTRRRRFDGALARYLMARDQHCRMPYCTAPIRHLDHVTPWRDGGPTTAANGQGLCERHSYVKEVPGWKIRVVEPKRPAASTDGRATVTPDARPGRHTTITTTPTGHTYQSHAPPA